ncbi:MAG: molecular chaperone DnaJ [Candidatus Thorarchaeota archaeon]|nr:molecular chaperone DnaJ [Candidatus Thorarchaeota archaeon]
MAEDDYYSILGVPKTATTEEIKKAYRRLAKELHPDLNPGDKAAEERLKKVNEAYDVLSDAEKRANYDRYGTADASGINIDGFGDLFREFFGGIGGFGFGREERGGPPPGDNLRINIRLSFEEAFFGTKRNIAFNRQVKCKTCGGSGAKPGSSPTRCRTCGGKGQVLRTMGFMSVAQTCPTCQGMGAVISTPCPDCRGSGLMAERMELTIPIPPGVEDGMAQRIRGGGNAGYRGGPHGDLIVMFSVDSHDRFVRRGLHVYSEVAVSFSKAVLGGEIEVDTMWGPARMRINPGTEHGTLFRMRGKGVHSDDGRQGDQLVRINIQVPTKLTKEQREYLERFEEVFG